MWRSLSLLTNNPRISSDLQFLGKNRVKSSRKACLLSCWLAPPLCSEGVFKWQDQIQNHRFEPGEEPSSRNHLVRAGLQGCVKSFLIDLSHQHWVTRLIVTQVVSPLPGSDQGAHMDLVSFYPKWEGRRLPIVCAGQESQHEPLMLPILRVIEESLQLGCVSWYGALGFPLLEFCQTGCHVDLTSDCLSGVTESLEPLQNPASSESISSDLNPDRSWHPFLFASPGNSTPFIPAVCVKVAAGKCMRHWGWTDDGIHLRTLNRVFTLENSQKPPNLLEDFIEVVRTSATLNRSTMKMLSFFFVVAVF